MKSKRIINVCLAIMLMFCSVQIVTGCKNENDLVEQTEQEKAYNLYVEYMSATGETPLTYEQWIANIKGDTGPQGIQGEQGPKGEAGKDGATWITGEGEPTINTISKEGDLYLDVLSKMIYLKGATSWSKIMDIESKIADGGYNWKSGKGAPKTDLGLENGEMYLDIEDKKIYVMESDEWKLVGLLQTEEEEPVVAQYDIIYYLDGGTNSEFNVSKLNEGEDLTLFEPIKYAYVFEGWYDTPDFNNKITKIENINSTKVLFAKWKINEEYFEGFPMISINTQNGVLPYDKETYINASFSITNCENEEYNFEVSMKDEYGDDDSVGIRLRGNSTQGYAKKPYRIKFDEKKSLLGLEKNKSWVLLADYLDVSSIRNYSAFTLAQKFEALDFTPSANHVVLFLNGEYKGLYLLTEQMDEKKGRADVEDDFDPTIDSDFPFFVEMDRNALLEGVTGVDNFKPDYFYPIEIKYPEYDDRGIEEGGEDIVFNYIKNYINAAFTSLVTGENVEFRGKSVSFEDLVDVDSFIEYWLVNEIMRNQDSTWGSIYMSKTKDGKLKFGPVWDFDWSMSSKFSGKPYEESEIESAYSLCILQFDTPLKSFVQKQGNFEKVVDKWNEIKSNILDVVEELRLYKKGLEPIAKYDAIYWYGETGDSQFDYQYDYVRLYLLDRYNFLDEYFNN